MSTYIDLNSFKKFLEILIEHLKQIQLDNDLENQFKDFLVYLRKETFNETYYENFTSWNLNNFFISFLPGELDPETLKSNIGLGNNISHLIEKLTNAHKNHINKVILEFEFLEQIGHLQSNLVIIGANGSGKTSYINYFKDNLKNLGVTISAQRWLVMENIQQINPLADTSSNLRKTQQGAKTFKETRHSEIILSEMNVLLKSLISENAQYNQVTINRLKKNLPTNREPLPKLYKLIEIFNSLFPKIEMSIEDGISITFKRKPEKTEYLSIMSLSDGEKTTIYLTSQVLQAPRSSFILIDEPEMHLHKLMVEEIWDRLEIERPDCKFVYLTHDLNFASSRINSKKIWIKKFKYPNQWELEQIPTEDDFPEELVMEIIGTEQPILFCEGDKTNSYDYKLLKLLFPKYKIRPVGGCSQVTSYTKIVNNKLELSKNAVGLIDADHRPEEAHEKLKENKIYILKVSEIENLFLNDKILNLIMSSKGLTEIDEKIGVFKNEVLKRLDENKNDHAIKYVSSKMNLFNENHFGKNLTLQQLKQEFIKHTEKFEIEKWHLERLDLINKIILEEDYPSAIKIYNDKSLLELANTSLRITDLVAEVYDLLILNDYDGKKIKKILLTNFPKEISELVV
ncbi:AAA family ATPase [Leeuwenhoekiella sp. MAR_2009_132]|uniref:AAA family ATPase n=1 Tax=Leeuwenhoekiella sp. MAR_2009_132 TaxID=1392489 RepID=UPI00048EC4C7|nr:AAA family ATPase [Leeuwenhoekiella sp. MAR_2009_132]